MLNAGLDESQAGIKIAGRYTYLWLIHVDVWQKPTQFCKAIILQLKNKLIKKKRKQKKTGNYLRVQGLRPSRPRASHILFFSEAGVPILESQTPTSLF